MTSSATVGTSATVLRNRGVAVDNAGDIYVLQSNSSTDSPSGRILKYTGTSTSTHTTITANQSHLRDLAISPLPPPSPTIYNIVDDDGSTLLDDDGNALTL